MVRKRRSQKASGKWWGENDKISAVTTWLALGSIPLTAAATGIPKDTLNRWKYSDWWKQLTIDIKNEENLQLNGRLKKIVDKALLVVEDRLENGNHQLNQKTGEIIRVPVNLKDSLKAANDLLERKDIIEDKPEKAQLEKTVDDRLAKLAAEFAKFAGAKQQAQPSKIIEAEVVEVIEQ